MLSWATEARKVKGSVTCEGKGLESVIVTDGESFTKTTNNGQFNFNINDNAEFVYIVTPSGYVADWSKGSPEFYKTTKDTNNFTFELLKADNTDQGYNIIAVGDPQPKKSEHFEEFISKPLDDICRTVSSLPTPTIGIVLGDICYDVFELQKRWKEEIVRTGIPFYPVIGNHDHDKKIDNDIDSMHSYRKYFGPENYAFFIGKDLVIVLDNIIYRNHNKYKEGYTDEIITWVEKLLNLVPKNCDIYVAQHSALNGRWHRTWNMDPSTVNCDKMIELLKGHNVTFLSGHNHVNGNFEYSETMFEHNVAAICGTWWDTYHCTDGTPRGYKVLTKKDENLTWYYKSIDKDPDFQYEIFLPGEAPMNPEHLVVNVWDFDPKWKIEWYENGNHKGLMEQVYELSPIHTAEIKAKYEPTGKEPKVYRLTQRAMHYFAAKPSAEAKEITIVITNRFGKVWKETIQLKN